MIRARPTAPSISRLPAASADTTRDISVSPVSEASAVRAVLAWESVPQPTCRPQRGRSLGAERSPTATAYQQARARNQGPCFGGGARGYRQRTRNLQQGCTCLRIRGGAALHSARAFTSGERVLGDSICGSHTPTLAQQVAGCPQGRPAQSAALSVASQASDTCVEQLRAQVSQPLLSTPAPLPRTSAHSQRLRAARRTADWFRGGSRGETGGPA